MQKSSLWLGCFLTAAYACTYVEIPTCELLDGFEEDVTVIARTMELGDVLKKKLTKMFSKVTKTVEIVTKFKKFAPESVKFIFR